MNILLKFIIWSLELLAALVITLGFLIFFFSFKRDDDPSLLQDNNTHPET